MRFKEIEDPQISEGFYPTIARTGKPTYMACSLVVGTFNGKLITAKFCTPYGFPIPGSEQAFSVQIGIDISKAD
ncbi:hypothetical protein [Leptolyngbya sp. PL-A3]|uniref:hypothetical protein n=1 Tax=Leptolyngbya sp. PL-A3 TaxID=2933911 RepID=UPI00329A2A3D